MVPWEGPENVPAIYGLNLHSLFGGNLRLRAGVGVTSARRKKVALLEIE